jgi:hypothetical protein
LLGYERHFNILLHTTISSSQSHFTITLSPHYTYTIGLAYNMDGLKDITWGQFKLYSCFALGFIGINLSLYYAAQYLSVSVFHDFG